MARTKYKVKKTDTLASLGNPQQILSLNPGLSKLSTGQTIFLPGKIGGGLGLSQPNAYQLLTGNYDLAKTLPTGAQGQVAVSGSNEPYRGQPTSLPQSPVTMQNISTGGGGFNATPMPSRYDVGNYQQPNQSIGAGAGTPQIYTGFQTPTSGSGTQGAMALGQNRVIPANTGIPNGNPSNVPNNVQSGSVTLPEGYVYRGGNDPLAQEQRRIWNQQAGGTGDERVYIRTKQDIWNMKANQRRRNGGNRNVSAVQPAPEISGNAVNASLSWRVG